MYRPARIDAGITGADRLFEWTAVSADSASDQLIASDHRIGRDEALWPDQVFADGLTWIDSPERHWSW